MLTIVMFIHFLTEFGLFLTEFTISKDYPLPVRQLASVLLRQYVESHWSHLSEKYQPPETVDHVSK